MAQVFSNNLSTVLAAPITALDTTIPITTGTGSNFPNVTGGDFFLVTLIGLTELEETSWEILKVTAVTADSFTVQRAQESTTAVIWPAGTRIECRHTAGTNARFESNIVAAEANANSYTDIAEADANTYTDTAIANLVDSSPAALDTLNELAAALGDDPNFATTVNNEISKKVYGEGTDNGGTQIETTGSDFIASDSTNSVATHFIYRLHSAGKLYLGTDDDQVSFRSPTVEFNGGNSFSSTDVGNWNTAYGWGDHGLENYCKLDLSGSYDILTPSQGTWLRSPFSGFLPNSNGSSRLGTTSWQWAAIDVVDVNLYGDINVGGQNYGATEFANFTSAYNWGDHSVENYLVEGSTVDPIVVGGSTTFESNGTIGANYSATKSGLQVRADENNDAFMAFHVSNDYAVYFGMSATSNRLEYGGWSLGTTRYQLWSSQDFALSSVTNGNTAYGWGDHAAEGYLTYPYVKWWRSAASSTDRIKIRLPWDTDAGKMLQFTVQSYGAYEQETYIISGYLYGSQNQWYLPKYTHVGSITPDIIFGRDSDGRAYISLRGNNYHGVAISYPNITYSGSDTDATNTGWEIARDNTLPNQVVVDEAVSLNPNKQSEWNTAYAWGDHATAGYLTSLSGAVLTTNNSSLNTDTRNTRGPTRLYRRDSNTDYSVQTYWTGTRWRLAGYLADAFHAECEVSYATSAGTASALSTSNTGSVQGSDLRSDRYIYSRNDTDTYIDMTIASSNLMRIVCGGSEAMRWGANYAMLIDSDTLRFGSSSDHRMYWDGGSNILYERTYTHGGRYYWQMEDNNGVNHAMIYMYANNVAPYVSLFGDGVEKMKTTTGGIDVTGAVTADNFISGGVAFTLGYGTGASDQRLVQSAGTFGFYNSTGTSTLSLDNSGNLTAAANITAYSDEKLKDNIQTLDGSKVYEMRGVSFTKDGAEGSGVIAQELEKVAPELVHDNSEYKSVAYGNLVGYLIEAVKELKAEIDELKGVK